MQQLYADDMDHAQKVIPDTKNGSMSKQTGAYLHTQYLWADAK